MSSEATDFESRGRLGPVGNLKRLSKGVSGAAGRLGSILRGPTNHKKRGPHPVASVSSGQLVSGPVGSEAEAV